MSDTLRAKLEEGKTVVKRLASDLDIAASSWAMFEAVNGRDAHHRAEMVENVKRLDLGIPYMAFSNTFWPYTLLALIRMSDQPSKDRLTLCRVAKLLQDREVRASVTSKSVRNEMKDFPSVQEELKERAERFEAFERLVPAKWENKNPPADTRLYNLVTKLRPIRDQFLAHSLPQTFEFTNRNEIRELFDLTEELVASAHDIFMGHGYRSLRGQIAFRLPKANEFWDRCQVGFVGDTP